jgi:hypothetical protein
MVVSILGVKQMKIVKEIIETGFGTSPEFLASVNQNNDSVIGQFIHLGTVFDYKIQSDSILYQENRQDSQWIQDYCLGYLNAQGIRCDTEGAYEWMLGYCGIHTDATPLKCSPGHTPCGGRCLPLGQKCKLGMRIAGAVQKIKKNIKEANEETVKREVEARKAVENGDLRQVQNMSIADRLAFQQTMKQRQEMGKAGGEAAVKIYQAFQEHKEKSKKHK